MTQIDQADKNEMPISFRGRLWQERPAEEAVIDILRAQGEGFSDFLINLAARRRGAAGDPVKYLTPKIASEMPNPFSFKDMDKAARRISDAIEEKEPIAIWSDYDVDGATSSAILRRYFNCLGVESKTHIPDRIKEGYGPNIDGMAALYEEGYKVVLVLDSGTTAFEPLGAATKLGMDVIVVDHHQAEETLPDVLALINPNRLDEPDEYGYLCTAGLAFMLAVAINSTLDKRAYFKSAAVDKVDLMPLVDIVALGTVADVVPLVGLNRAFVATGLRLMQKTQNIGLKKLMDVSSTKPHDLKAYHCGFQLGPRVNAAGRIGLSHLGSDLLSCDDEEDAEAIAKQLDDYNTQRKDIERNATEEAQEMIEAVIAQTGKLPEVLCVASMDWHEGIIGIVAGRLKEIYDRPTFVFSILEDGTAKGSGRSMPGFDMGRAVIGARQNGILVAGGGHAMAAGLSVRMDKYAQMQQYIAAEVIKSGVLDRPTATSYDLEMSVNDVAMDRYYDMQKIGPFGQNNPEPNFVIRNAYVREIQVLKDVHYKIELSSGPAGGNRIKALYFNAKDTPIGEGLMNSKGTYVDLIVSLQKNEWQGRISCELLIRDARPAGYVGDIPAAAE